MSIRIMSLVWELALPDSQKLVLLALADCANDEGFAWPSVATLCRKTTRSERTVQGVLIELEGAGYITRKQIPGKGCHYTVNPRSDCAPQPLRPAEDAPPQPLRQTPAAAADKPSRTIISKKATPSSIAHATRGTRVPVDFVPAVKPESLTAVAMAQWPPGEVGEQVEHFIDHHTAAGTLSRDWQASWRTWVKNWRKFSGKRPSNDRYDDGLGRSARAAISVFGAPERPVAEPEAETLRRVGPSRGEPSFGSGDARRLSP